MPSFVIFHALAHMVLLYRAFCKYLSFLIVWPSWMENGNAELMLRRTRHSGNRDPYSIIKPDLLWFFLPLYPIVFAMTHLIQIINARLVEGDSLVSKSLCFDSKAGIFVSPPNPSLPSALDLQGRIVAPGFLDLQINGAYGFDFSEDIAGDAVRYNSRFQEARRKLITTGTTSFLPTMTSQRPERYHQVRLCFK